MKRTVFRNRWLPYGLVAPQVAITLVFFFWPAFDSLRLSLYRASPFGDRLIFIGLRNFERLASEPAYFRSVGTSFVFSFFVTFLGLALALLLASLANAKSVLEAASVDGAGPIRRFFAITFPLLSPVTFFLFTLNMTFAFFETFGLVHAVTQGGPGDATSIMVYRAWKDGFDGLQLGFSAAQSVILMILVITLTAFQFRYAEKKVTY